MAVRCPAGRFPRQNVSGQCRQQAQVQTERRPSAQQAGWTENQLLSWVGPQPQHTAAPQAKETNVYLQYIIDHYEQLPETTVFMHAHRCMRRDAAALASLATKSFGSWRQCVSSWCPDWISQEVVAHARQGPAVATAAVGRGRLCESAAQGLRGVVLASGTLHGEQ